MKGMRAVVCGASRGIGRAIANGLADKGLDTLLIARSEDALREVADSLNVTQGQEHKWLAMDFMRPDLLSIELKKHINEASPYHILVNNTGGPSPGPLVEAELKHLADAFTMHVLTAQSLTSLLAPGMRSAGYGRIINIISTSVKEPIEGLGVSNTIRGAMASWSKTMSRELGPSGITVNNILPGYTETERLEQIIDMKSVTAGVPNDTMAAQLKRVVPAGRFAAATEIAAAACFLASPDAGYINGINLPVDGGRTKSL